MDQTSEANSRWTTQNTAVVLTGITFGALSLPTKRSKSILWFTDSIGVGVNAIGSGGDSTLRGRMRMAYPHLVSERLGAEMGLVGFGGQGWATTGGGSVPIFPTTYPLVYPGVARSFAGWDAIVVIQGQNDPDATDVTAAVTAWCNYMIANTTRATKIIVVRPLSGRHSAHIVAGIAACTAPSRINYVDSTGWFNSANSPDGIHPYGYEHLTGIEPKATAALRAIIAPERGTRTARTINLSLFQDAAGTTPAVDATGLIWSFFDQTSADTLAVAADSGTTAAISGGALSLTVYSTKSAGQQGYLVLSNADGSKAFRGVVTLS